MNRGRAFSACALPLLVAAIVVGCGSSDPAPKEQAASPAQVPGSADAGAARVIGDWASALSDGDIAAAAESFDLPSVGQNGSEPLELNTREQVQSFNEALPCGAKLVRAEQTGRFTIATFELTERPGEGDCGQGVGLEAMTAFVIEDGLITEWRRVADLPPAETGPVV